VLGLTLQGRFSGNVRQSSPSLPCGNEEALPSCGSNMASGPISTKMITRNSTNMTKYTTPVIVPSGKSGRLLELCPLHMEPVLSTVYTIYKSTFLLVTPKYPKKSPSKCNCRPRLFKPRHVFSIFYLCRQFYNRESSAAGGKMWKFK
jgi:hypothetical protein